MSGYKRDIVVRIVPANGAESVFWFNDQLSDVGMHTAAVVSYPKTIGMHEDINRTLRPVVYARRARVSISVVIASMADQWFLQEIEEALDDADNYSVFLSLDGGVTEREIVWADESGIAPAPLRGKTIVGATFTLNVQTKYPIARRGPMMTDPGVAQELIQNGGFEEWTDATHPLGWAVNSECSVIQDGTFKTAGAFSAKVTKLTASSNYGYFGFAPNFSMNPACWYRMRARGRGAQATTAGLYLQLANISAPASGGLPFSLGFTSPAVGQSIGPSDWGYGVGVSRDLSGGAQFATIDVYFRGPRGNPWKRDDQFQVRLQGIVNAGEIAYYDEISIQGPVLRPGYSIW